MPRITAEPAAAPMPCTNRAQHAARRTIDPVQVIVQHDRLPGDQLAILDIDPNVMPAVAQHRMLAACRIADDGQPALDPLRIERVGIAPVGRPRADAQRSGIEIGMPDDPRVGGRDVRVFRESAPPIAAGR